jgi:F-type H+-transporting ATPase subunit c
MDEMQKLELLRDAFPQMVAIWSIIVAGVTIAVGSIGPALGEARALAEALSGIARQPDEAGTITRTLFVGMAMVESTAIYCLLISLILIFANPFWGYFKDAVDAAMKAGG